jgi:lipoprotein-anchoring transpeptidase ErfK/SrfK
MRPTRRGGVGAALVIAFLLVAVSVAVVVVAAPSKSSPAELSAKRLAEPSLPASPRPAFAPKNVPLGKAPVAYWTPVVVATTVRARPAAGRALAEVATRTPEDTTNLVLVSGHAKRAAGRLWVRVRAAGSPDDVYGWVPRSSLGGYTPVRTRLVVDRARLTATLFRDGRPVFRTEVGVGAPQTPTPAGNFYVRDKLYSYKSPFYGPVAFGTSARSASVTDWPAGGFVGIHGTDQPDLIPGRVSHGCIRLKNRAILRLARLMSIGTPVRVI